MTGHDACLNSLSMDSQGKVNKIGRSGFRLIESLNGHAELVEKYAKNDIR